MVSGLLGVFLRVVETTVRQNSPDAPIGARFGAVAFVHRFGSYLNSHGHLDSVAVHTLDAPGHAGGWSVDASVTIPGWDRHGLERLVRYCARPPLSQERLGRLDDQMLVYSLRKANSGLAIGGWVSYALATRNVIAIFRQDGAFNLDSTASPLSGRKG